MFDYSVISNQPRNPLRLIAVGVLGCCALLSGCVVGGPTVLPSHNEFAREQLVVHSDFELPEHHRLIDDLVVRRVEIGNLLGIRPSDTPIHVYLFDSESKFREYVSLEHPDFPDRRALFVKNEDELKIYAAWNPRVAEDLRHEVTHGYLHSVVTGMPLWLDEGIAEFFEVERGKRGLNASHLYLLNSELAAGGWRPDLERLESLTDAAAMNQLDYAESWLWTHYLLSSQEIKQKPIIQAHLQQLVEKGEAFPISAAVDREVPDSEDRLVWYLRDLNRLR